MLFLAFFIFYRCIGTSPCHDIAEILLKVAFITINLTWDLIDVVCVSVIAFSAVHRVF